jgi:hypothetical protein
MVSLMIQDGERKSDFRGVASFRITDSSQIHRPRLCLTWRFPKRRAVSLYNMKARKGDAITAFHG